MSPTEATRGDHAGRRIAALTAALAVTLTVA